MTHDVLVIAEHREGMLSATTLELVNLARSLARDIGCEVKVALMGHQVEPLASQIAAYADVLLAQHPLLQYYSPGGYLQALRAATRAEAPWAILLPHSSQGFDLAPLVAAAWTRSGREGETVVASRWPSSTECAVLVTNCLDIRDTGAGDFIATRKILNEKIVVKVSVGWPFVATVRPAAVKAAEPLPSPGSITNVDASIDESKLGARFLRYEKPQVQDIDITTADVVVSAGRGIKEKKNLALVEELAKRLGGVVGASRPLTDMEWLPKTRQVGQSGKTVRPKLYLACGISGAMQHVSGMKDSSLIIAVNTDPSAPIFEVAHVGIVANVLELLPAVLKELKA